MTSTLIPKVNGEQPLVVVSHVKRKVTQSQLGVSPAQPTSLSPQNGSATPGSCARRAHAGWAAAAAAAAAAIARPRLPRARRRDQVRTLQVVPAHSQRESRCPARSAEPCTERKQSLPRGSLWNYRRGDRGAVRCKRRRRPGRGKADADGLRFDQHRRVPCLCPCRSSVVQRGQYRARTGITANRPRVAP
jgi:hypothetical protein